LEEKMRFHTSGQFVAGQVDVDPLTGPENILSGHILSLPEADFSKPATALWLALAGTGSEALTLTLYFLLDETDYKLSRSKYISADHRWFQFASGVVVTNGTLQTVTSGIPAGGVIYARRTTDSITGGQTRNLLVSWV
jgi:hypothetical protein